jgi:hypothetical protein
MLQIIFVVAGVVFFAVRALLVLFPTLTSGFPIKKWAAAASTCGRGVLSAAVRRRGGDAALVLHDGGGVDRGDVGPSRGHVPDARGPRHSLPASISLSAFSASRSRMRLLPLPKHSNEACSEAGGDQQKEQVLGRVAHGTCEATRMPISREMVTGH